MLNVLLTSLEELMRAALALGEQAKPVRMRGVLVGTRASAWISAAHAVLKSPSLTSAKAKSLTASAQVEGFSEFLDKAHVGTFEADLLPKMLSQCFLNASSSAADPVKPAVGSLAFAFQHGRAQAVAEAFLLNCELEAGIDDRPWHEQMLKPILPEPIELRGSARIRAATRDDLRDLADTFSMPGPLEPGFTRNDVMRVRAVLEMPFEYQLPHVLADSAILDLALLVDALRVSTNTRVIRLATRWSPLQFPFQGGAAEWWQSDLSASTGDLIRSLLPQETGRLEQLEERHRIALRRFSMALEREEPNDQLVDLWIGIEALFATGSENIRSSCSRRAAKWLEQPSVERELNESYSIRSAIVHGAPHSRRETLDAVELVQTVLRESLLRVLRDPVAFRAHRLD